MQDVLPKKAGSKGTNFVLHFSSLRSLDLERTLYVDETYNCNPILMQAVAIIIFWNGGKIHPVN